MSAVGSGGGINSLGVKGRKMFSARRALHHPYPRAFLHSPQFRSHQETKLVARRTQPLRSHGKIGYCEQSIIRSKDLLVNRAAMS